MKDFNLTREQYQQADKDAFRALAAAVAFYTGVGAITASSSLATSARLSKLQDIYRKFVCIRAIRYLIYVSCNFLNLDDLSSSRPDLDEIRERFDQQSRLLLAVDTSWADWLLDVKQTLDDCASDVDSMVVRTLMLRDHLLVGLVDLIAADPSLLITHHDRRMLTEAGVEVPR